jgi:hypothetical protein
LGSNFGFDDISRTASRWQQVIPETSAPATASAAAISNRLWLQTNFFLEDTRRGDSANGRPQTLRARLSFFFKYLFLYRCMHALMR